MRCSVCWLRPGPTERAGKVCCEGLGQGGRVRVRSRREVEESGHWGMEVEGGGKWRGFISARVSCRHCCRMHTGNQNLMRKLPLNGFNTIRCCSSCTLPPPPHNTHHTPVDTHVHSPSQDTFENVMRVSQMLVQGSWNRYSPLLQLPHLQPDHLRHFKTRKVKSTDDTW